MKNHIAVIGCGHWGKNLVRNYYELEALNSICDSDEKISESLAKEFNVPVRSYEEILADDSIKGVVLAVPAPMHCPLALKAFQKSKHVFVEKPLALNESDAQKMIDSSVESNKHLMVGHLLQYHACFIKLKKLISEGLIGETKYLYSNRLSFGKVRLEEDVLWSFAPHDISMILSLTNELPEKIYVESSSIFQNNNSDISTLNMSFKNNLKAHVSTSWLHPFKEQRLVIIGETGMLVFDDTLQWDKKLSLYPHKINLNSPTEIKKANPEFIQVDKSEPLKDECKHFLDLISDKVNAVTDGNEGMRVLKVLSSATLSEQTNKEIFLK